MLSLRSLYASQFSILRPEIESLRVGDEASISSWGLHLFGVTSTSEMFGRVVIEERAVMGGDIVRGEEPRRPCGALDSLIVWDERFPW